MKKVDAKVDMLEHSEAKVELYSTYLAIYLNILSRVSYVKQIFIFDLFCGEGIYQNNLKGSPLAALEVIKNHYFANNHACPNISLWFNDNGLSQIEDGVYRVDRVERFAKQTFVPNNVRVEYRKDDYEKVLASALFTVKKTKNAKALFFLDQYGYKDVKPEHIRDILATGNSEALIFLPISFLYRFAEKSVHSDFSGGKPLKDLLEKLFGSNIPSFSSPYHFLNLVIERFKAYLAGQQAFVNAFTIQRDLANVYALLFFTTSIRGCEKMLEAKWAMDSEVGLGHRIEKSQAMFDPVEVEGYSQRIKDYISQADYRTNEELFRFGLENGFLPKHTKEALQKLKQDHEDLEVFALDGKTVEGFYIRYNPTRKIGFRLRRIQQG
jgi:three-Cys-motif partner protein